MKFKASRVAKTDSGFERSIIERSEIDLPEGELLPKMKEIIEQKGKPCCINMITEEDNKFLADIEKIKQKELRAKAREAAAAEAEANPPGESQGDEPNASNKDLQ